jgi:hypothetical protein
VNTGSILTPLLTAKVINSSNACKQTETNAQFSELITKLYLWVNAVLNVNRSLLDQCCEPLIRNASMLGERRQLGHAGKFQASINALIHRRLRNEMWCCHNHIVKGLGVQMMSDLWLSFKVNSDNFLQLLLKSESCLAWTGSKQYTLPP